MMTAKHLLITALLSLFAINAHAYSYGDEPAKPAVKASSPNSVAISRMSFGDGPMTIKVGETVTWTNHDNMPHTVTSPDENGPLNSGMMKNGATFSHTFAAAGTYYYYCEYHRGMRSKVIVE